VSAIVRPALWGVLNTTPDSFSDGGRFLDPEHALSHAREMIQAGAVVIDVGGESTRPGVSRVDPQEEQDRVLPVVESLVQEGIPVSIDTMNAATATAAMERGVSFVNDVSGGLADPTMFEAVAQFGCDYVMMHWRGHSATMDSLATYDDVVTDVRRELKGRVEAAIATGIDPARIVLDPGIGFAKNPQQNWELLAGIDQLVSLGFRVLVGASRKRFLGGCLPVSHEVTDRDAPSAALGVLLAERGVWGLRVHNVPAHRDALNVWQSFHERGPS